MSVKWGHKTDIHSDASGLDQYLFGNDVVIDKQYRQTSTAIAAYAESLADFVSAGVDFVAQAGDLINETSSTSGWATALSNILDERAESGPDGLSYLDVLGNHEAVLNGNSNYTYNSYWTAVDASDNPISRSNVWQGADSEDLAFTYEINGIRFIALFSVSSSQSESIGASASQQSWLTNTALDTPLPVVVLSHSVLSNEPDFAYGAESNHATIRGILEAAGNVQAVFSGHYHRNGMPGYGAPFHSLVNGIQYFNMRGSVLGANNGRSSDTATLADCAHYVVELIPNAVNGMAQVEITGFRKGKSKIFETFIAG